MIFKNLPFQLFVCLVFAAWGGQALPIEVLKGAYTLSTIFKEILLVFLPFVIFSYISTAILTLDRQGPLLIFAIIALVMVSNALAVSISYGVAWTFLPILQSGCQILSLNNTVQLEPYFIFHLPQLIGADKMMLFALVFGVVFSYWKVPKIETLSLRFQKNITRLLVKGFIPLLPIYILGFALKMSYENGLLLIFKHYGGIFLLICGLLTTYIFLAYAVSKKFNLPATIKAVRHMIPAGITGFSTMSSAVTMPVTLASTTQNLTCSHYAGLVIPTTMNIHMMADALSLPLLTFGVMQLCGIEMPSFQEFLLFIPAFCLAKFSLASIPGGTIIVMLPVLQAHFNIPAEITSLITTLYILQDPLFTMGNVMGNGAFAILSEKIINPARRLNPIKT